jgi:hypothetical protein
MLEMTGTKIKKMFLPCKLFRIVDFQSFVEIEPWQDQSVGELSVVRVFGTGSGLK